MSAWNLPPGIDNHLPESLQMLSHILPHSYGLQQISSILIGTNETDLCLKILLQLPAYASNLLDGLLRGHPESFSYPFLQYFHLQGILRHSLLQ